MAIVSTAMIAGVPAAFLLLGVGSWVRRC